MRSSNNKTKHSVLSIFLKLGVVLLALFGVSATGVGVYDICEKANYDGCYNYKLDLLRKAFEKGTKKAVFVGGSATNFGIRADYFEEKTGIRSINMGFSAGRSFDAYLNAIRPYMKEGDSLFLLPEPGYWAGAFHTIDSGTILFQQHNARDSISIQSPLDLWNYVTGWILNGWTGWGDSLKYLTKKVSVENLNLGSWTIYDRWECNENGDFTLSQEGAKQDFNPSLVHYSKKTEFSQELGTYVRNQMPGVEAFIVSCPIDISCISNVEQASDSFANYAAASNLPCLLTPAESGFPHDCFLDTQYHLESSHAFEFTERIINSYQSL